MSEKLLSVCPTEPADLPALLAIYAHAREEMRRNGNPNQWIRHPREELVEDDIRLHRSLAVVCNGRVCGVFAFLTGEDPTYRVIEGAWLNDAPYGTIHRIASDNTVPGVLAAAVAYGSGLVDNIRIDTHADNSIMHHILPKLGFVRCGTIYVQDDTSDHSPRIAYQKIVR